jgi:hypothetical protein
VATVVYPLRNGQVDPIEKGDRMGAPPAPREPVDVRVVSVRLSFDELLLLSIQVLGVQVVLGVIAALVLKLIGVI